MEVRMTLLKYRLSVEGKFRIIVRLKRGFTERERESIEWLGLKAILCSP